MKHRHTLISLAAAAALGCSALASAENPDHSFSWYDYVGAASPASTGQAFGGRHSSRFAAGNPQHSFEWSDVLSAHRREADIAGFGQPAGMPVDEGRESPN